MLKRLLKRVDLHIVAIQLMVLPLYSSVFKTVLENTDKTSDVGFLLKVIMSLPIFLLPQGIILTRELKRDRFKFWIGDMEYFLANEIFTLFTILTFWAVI